MMRSFIGALLACWSLSVFADPQALKAQLQDYYFDAARRGDVEMLNTFIEAGYSLSTVDDKGYTALILAAYHGQGPAVEQLLAAEPPWADSSLPLAASGFETYRYRKA